MSNEILTFDFSSFKRMADRIGVAAQQVPYALATSLNQSAFQAREDIVGMWPSAVNVRNKAFLGWALRVVPATKTNLRVEINDHRADGRGNLKLHADGGIRTTRGRLAIPSLNVRRGSHGVVKGQRPVNLKDKFQRGDILYARIGKGKRRKLKLMFTLKGSAPIKKDVPFRETFEASMRREMAQRAPAAMLKAMRTAIRK